MSSSMDIPPDLIGQSSLYNVPDPLLRRLRLEEPSGASIADLDKFFKDKELLVLYAGSEYGENNLREFHRVSKRLFHGCDNTVFSARSTSCWRESDCSADEAGGDVGLINVRSTEIQTVIYVSTDVSPSSAARVLAQKPWLRMTFSDNSDFAPVGKAELSTYETEIEDVARGEEFVQAGELEIGMEKVELGVEEYQTNYVRPLSRAGLTVLMSTYATPSIAVYHLPTHTFIAKNVRPSAFSSAKVDKNYATWLNGGDPSLSIRDIVQSMRWPLLALVLAVIYHLFIRIGGEQYNYIPILMNRLGWKTRELLGTGLGAGRAL